jgi:hypothetical protein
MRPSCATTTLDVIVPDKNAALKDMDVVKEEGRIPAVIITAWLDPHPVACLVATVVADSQKEASAEVESNRSFAVESILVNCDPLTVANICAFVLKKLMPDSNLLIKGNSYVAAWLLLDCSRAPDVRTCFIEASIPTTNLHLIELLDTHSLSSEAVPPTRAARL